MTHPAEDTTLVIVCKRPRLGQGKQRLTQHLASDQVLAIAQHLLACTLEDAHQWRGPVALCVTHSNDLPWAKSVAPAHSQCLVQSPGNLGDKLQAIDQQLRQPSHHSSQQKPSQKRLLYIGTDAPTLTVATFEAAAQALNTHDVVLTPADDGGVVIMANRAPWPTLPPLPWSTDQLGHALAHACKRQGLSTTHCQRGFDIDELPDLKRLIKQLPGDPRPARQRLFHCVQQILHTTSP